MPYAVLYCCRNCNKQFELIFQVQYGRSDASGECPYCLKRAQKSGNVRHVDYNEAYIIIGKRLSVKERSNK